jgi:choline dehydrogenase
MDPPLRTNSAGRLSYGLPQVYRVIEKGKRVDSYTAYLRPVMASRADTLVVRTGARVERILFENEHGHKRAIGVEYVQKVPAGGGDPRWGTRGSRGTNNEEDKASASTTTPTTPPPPPPDADAGPTAAGAATNTAATAEVTLRARATREVILCAGVFFTPHLLLKSGVGPAKELTDLQVPVVADVPGVGKNLLARTNVLFFFGNGSVVPEMNPFVMRDPATTDLYEQQHRGPYSLGALGIYTVVKGRFPGEDDYIMLMTDVIPEVAPRMFALGCANLRVHAPGQVTLDPLNPLGARHPHIELNMMASELDRRAIRQCLRDVRDLIHEPIMASKGFHEVFPTQRLIDNTDEELNRWISRGYTFYSWHATGTAKMACGGRADIGRGGDHSGSPVTPGVLDSRLRVVGVTGLRVVDASAIPDMIEAGPMATLYMLGERAADLIKEDYK